MGGLKLGSEAQQKFDDAKKNPDKEGTLEKKGAKRKNWNKRWFCLKDNYLFYCKSPQSQPQGIINLHGCTITKIAGPTIAKNHCFSLLAPKSVSIDAKWTGRTYFMAAGGEKEMNEWMKALEENGRKAAERASIQKTQSAKQMEVSKGESDDESENDEKKHSKESDSEEEPKKIVKKEDSDSEEEAKEKEKPKADSDEEEEKKEKPKKKRDGEKKKKKEKKSSGEKKEKKHKKERKEKKEKKAEEAEVKEEKKEEEKKEEKKEEKPKEDDDSEEDSD